MKYILAFILIPLSLVAKASKFYISTESGDDNRTSLQAQTPATPWKTIYRLNGFKNLKPGDSVLFKRGEEFYGTLIINTSGTNKNVIFYGAYGSGNNPVITGFTTISKWDFIGKGVYESPAINSMIALNVLTFDGRQQAMGRWPKLNSVNNGYLVLQSHSANKSITSSQIINAPDFIGGEIVIRKVNWALDRATVTSQTSTTISYNSNLPIQKYNAFGPSLYSPRDGYGFFFQNHVNACTQLGEWAYDGNVKKVRIFFGTTRPSSHTVKVSTNDSLVYIVNRSYIVFSNITFTGANAEAVKMDRCHDIQFEKCEIDFSGITAIRVLNSSSYGFKILNCVISHSNNNGLTCGSSTGWTIRNTAISNIGMIRGMGLSGAGNYEAISYVGGKSLLQHNAIRDIGYNGINFRGNSVLIENNFIDSFCVCLQDGGGIYTYSETNKVDRKIINNIILNGLGDRNGVGATGPNVHGIYIDGGARNIDIIGNTVANCSFSGIQLNFPQNVNIQDNTLFNNGSEDGPNFSAGFFIQEDGPTDIAGLTIKQNIVVADRPTQLVIYSDSKVNNVSRWGTIDSNYYCRPILEPAGINVNGAGNIFPYNQGGIISYKTKARRNFYSLDAWQAFSGHDLHSNRSPREITDTSDLRFEYNATSVARPISLDLKYIDVKGVSYSGKIILAPYSSVVLIRDRKI